MSSFDEYYNQWKKDNNVKEEKAYLPTSAKEISTSANNYIDNVIMPKMSQKTMISQKPESKKYGPKKDRNILDSIGKTIENGWLSMQNGIRSAGQTIGRAITNTQADRLDFWNEQDKIFLQNRIENENDSEKKAKLEEAINNPLITGEQIRKESEKTTKKIDNKKIQNQEKIQKNAESINSPVGKYIARDIVPAIGQMLPGMVGGGLGSTYFISSATGNYYDDAKQRGMSEDQAKMYSGTMGIIEGSLEALGGKLTTNVGKQLLKKNIKGALVNYGLDIAENFLEEAIVEPLSELVAEKTAGKDKANWENIEQRFLKSGIDGAVTSMITGGVSGIIGGVGSKFKNNKYTDINVGETFNNNSQNGLKGLENIVSKNQNIDLQQNTTQNQITQLQNETIQNGNIGQINNSLANSEKTLYNNIVLGETKNVPIEELLSLQTEGGYRKQEQIMDLREDISKNGIQTPIELVKNNDGSISIENGNHRLQIAKELGMNEIPIKFVESWDNIGIDNTDSNSVKKWEEGYNGNNENRAGINESNERTELFKRSMDDNRNQLENRTTATANDRLYNKIQAYNDRTSSNSTFEKNNQELEGSSSINLLEKDIAQEGKFPTRHETIRNNREIARENIENISTWKDKKSGIRYQLETMERNMYDIIPDKAEAKKINDTYFEPIHTSEAEKQKFINNYNDRIRQFDLNKYESEAVQFLGEKKYNPDFNKGNREDILKRNEIASKINKNTENGKINQEKVNNAIEEFRKIYDELFELENKTLKENGYKEKPYRKGYFPHFIDYMPETKTEKVLNKLGFKIDKRPLPTDIAGITEQFVPGKTWNKSTLERKNNKTDYNALKGFDTYISQASDNIFHTDNIQKLRGLENEIRYQYSEKGVQERIDNILNDETLYEDEKQVLLDKVLEQTNNPMPNLVTELRRYTNALANKKSEADRSIEQSAGRSIYSTVNAIENRFGANAVGLNIGSAITNFIPITQAYSQVSTKNMGRAIIDTVKSYANNDGFVDKSAFLTSRLNQSEKLYKTSLEKISDKTSFLFNAIDEVTSNIVVRGKYFENIQNGMSESEAIKNADQFARNVIADRSKGALPTKFEEKNPVTKMFTQFQLEVNNQYRYMFKDLPRDLAEKGLAGIALAFFKMFVGAWAYNEVSEKITGRKPAYSPIDLVFSSYKTITDKDMKTYDKVANIGTEITEQLPFVGGLVGGGRVPVNGAIPNVLNLTKAGIGLATGEMDSNKAMNTIGKELSKPLYYLLPPFGGGQIKKSVEGIQTVNQGGSYSVDSKGEETLRFPVENPNAGDYIKAGVFGKYALPKAKEYVDGGFKSLNAKDTKLYKNSEIDYDILKKYIADRDEKVNSKAKSKETKTKIIKNLPISTDQKWEIYKSDIFSETEKKDGITEKEEYEKLLKQGFSKNTLIQWYDVNKIEGKKDVDGKTIEGSSQGQKALAIMKMNVNDEQKNKMLSLITTSKNPETVGTLSRLEKSEEAYTDYFALNKSDTFFQSNISRDDVQDIQDLGINQDEFMKFAQNIGSIKSERNKNGKTISGSKKKAVANYINSLNLSSGEKAILFAKAGYPDKNYKQAIYSYINGLNLSATRKKEIWDSLGYK